MSRTLKGRFRPHNPDKYKGNPTRIEYRSSWELSMMKWLDKREDIIWWQSEEKAIWYTDPVQKKKRRYFPDFIIHYRRKDGICVTEVIEVKPARQVSGPPVQPKRKTKSWLTEVMTYATNTAKWRAAETWCEDRGYNFRIITEHDLGLVL